MKVFWTATALDQLRRIRDYIAADSANYARRMVERIRRRTWQIKKSPFLGGIVSEYERDDIREVLEGSYRIIYRVSTDCAEVLAIVHAAQQLPPDILPLT